MNIPTQAKAGLEWRTRRCVGKGTEPRWAFAANSSNAAGRANVKTLISRAYRVKRCARSNRASNRLTTSPTITIGEPNRRIHANLAQDHRPLVHGRDTEHSPANRCRQTQDKKDPGISAVEVFGCADYQHQNKSRDKQHAANEDLEHTVAGCAHPARCRDVFGVIDVLQSLSDPRLYTSQVSVARTASCSVECIYRNTIYCKLSRQFAIGRR